MKKIKEKIKSNYKEILIFLLILMIAIFSRGYKLDSLPSGIHVDEAGMAYDAFCLATNGTDRWLNKFPVYLENFGGGQSALYAYLAAIFVKVCGLNMLSIRMPAFLLSILAIITVYFTTKKECSFKKAQAFTFFIAIMPWHIMASRWGLDCNLLAPMMMISVCMLIRAKNVKGYILSGILFGLTLYTYALSYMILPVFLLVTLLYMLCSKKIKFKDLFPLGIPMFIIALPLMLMILVNNGVIGEIRGFITIQKLPEYRGAEVSLSNIKDNIKFIKTIFTNDNLPYNALEEFGTVYRFSILLILVGGLIELKNLIYNIKNKKFDFGSVMVILCGSILFCLMLTVGPNINKANAIYIPMMYFIVTTMKLFYKNAKIIFYLVILLFILYFTRFELFYFNNMEKIYGTMQYFEKDYLEVFEYVNNKYKEEEIHILTSTAEPYIYTLFKNQISPQEFNSKLHEETKNDDLYSYNNYYFKDITLNSGNEVCIVNYKEDFETYILLQNVGFTEDENTKDKDYRVFYREVK